MNEINKNLLFNPHGSDELFERKIIGGNTTNILDLSVVKYTWAKNLYHEMMGNFWIPEKQDLTKDKSHYECSTKSVQNIVSDILSSLTFLDSLQTNNLPKIADYVTAPELTLLFSIQAFQEAIHSQSYGNIIQTIIPKEELKGFFRGWEKYPELNERNQFLAGTYQIFLNDKTNENFAKVLIADYIMEGLSFFMGFNILYEISYQTNTFFGLVDTIRLIQRDELSHVELFKNVIKEFQIENKLILNDEMIIEMFRYGFNLELNWAKSLIRNNFENNTCFNFNEVEVETYLKYIANRLIKNLDCGEIFPENETKTKMRYLENISGLFGTELKSNFFETNVTNYNMWSHVKGWNNIEETLKQYK